MASISLWRHLPGLTILHHQGSLVSTTSLFHASTESWNPIWHSRRFRQELLWVGHLNCHTIYTYTRDADAEKKKGLTWTKLSKKNKGENHPISPLPSKCHWRPSRGASLWTKDLDSNGVLGPGESRSEKSRIPPRSGSDQSGLHRKFGGDDAKARGSSVASAVTFTAPFAPVVSMMVFRATIYPFCSAKRRVADQTPTLP